MNKDIGAAVVSKDDDENHQYDYYNKVIPSHFSKEGDDGLMRSLIDKYSVEGKTDGKPNGHFYITRGDLKDASSEVITAHLGFTGAQKDKYLNEREAEMWNHFDVNGNGFLESTEVPQYMRMLVGNVEATNGLQ